MSDTTEDYNDSNRAFLQAFLAQNTLTFEAARPLLAAILSLRAQRSISAEDITLEEFNSYVSQANQALSPLDLEIRSTFHQQSRERYYALVNTTSDSFTQLATTYSAEEIAYVKRLLDGMFDGANNRGKREAMCLSSMDAVQLGKAAGRRETQTDEGQGKAPNLSLREAENMLDRLQMEGWLEKSKKSFYALSPRALMELKGWLVDTYNEPMDDESESTVLNKIKFCHACKEIITVGQRCSNYNCPCRLHDICISNFFRIQRSQTCPLCDSTWDGNHHVGEKAITTSESYQKGKRKSTSAQQNVNVVASDGNGDD